MNAVRSDAAAQTGREGLELRCSVLGRAHPEWGCTGGSGGGYLGLRPHGCFETRPPDPIGTNGCQRLGIRIRLKGRIFTPGDLISDVCGPAAASV